MKITVLAALVTAIFAVASPVRADDCLNGYLQRGILTALVESKTVQELREVRANQIFKNDVTEAIYSLRNYELHRTAAAEEMLIRAVPQSDITLSLLYHLTYPGAELDARPHLFEEYLDAVYNSVRKSRKRYPVLLRLAVLAQGGDLGEATTDYVARLYAFDRIGVSKSLMTMPEQETRLICGEDTIPCPQPRHD